jgi:hypothetical protein
MLIDYAANYRLAHDVLSIRTALIGFRKVEFGAGGGLRNLNGQTPA